MKSFMARQILPSILYLALVPIPALAQGSIILFQMGGPTTVVEVINNADRSVLTDIGDKRVWIDPRGGQATHTYGYGTLQNAAIVARACSTTPTMVFVNPPPVWASDPSVVGDAAIPSNYENPSISVLKEKVNNLKDALRDRVGGEGMKKRLDAWFKTVKKEGYGFKAQNCQDPDILIAGTDVSQWGYGHTILFLIEGTDGKYKMEQKVN